MNCEKTAGIDFCAPVNIHGIKHSQPEPISRFRKFAETPRSVRNLSVYLRGIFFYSVTFQSPFSAHILPHFTHKIASVSWPQLVAWHSGRTSVSGRRTFPVLRSTCSWWVTTNVGKPSAMGQPTRPTQPFILSGSIKWVVSWNQMCAAVYR